MNRLIGAFAAKIAREIAFPGNPAGEKN